ncbi:RNA polymerase sigma factor [Chondrinema litorale]|uniref:RNA polymerase sigma factor n=1 Tax=Chondrinema litorale TaxID=2994555 RepID=UPI002543C2E3|nr:RNA polymerase sigma-70 factor [Chondrinema litorale]UZR97374.1 RNA polymerase sigma-70 factor [Chondrinema litorale]
MKIDIERIKKRIASHNDKLAFRSFYQYYFERLFAFALRFLKSRELAEEVISEVFLKIWNNRSNLLEIKNIETYLYVLVKNHSLNVIKKSLKEQNTHLSLDDAHFELAIENFTPEAAYFAEELRDEIDKVIETLPTACKNAFFLVKEDQLNYAQAAEILNVSPYTVKNQVLKAVKRIREHLTQKRSDENLNSTNIRNINNLISFLIVIENLIFFLD